MSAQKGVSVLLWSSADKVLTNGIALVISILLARMLAPSEYGVIATASIFTVLLSLFVEPGMTSGLIQKKNSDKLDYSTILVFNLFIGAALYLLLFAFADVIAGWFEIPVLAAVIRVMGLQIIVGGVNSVQIAYVQKNMMFKRYFICSIMSVIISATVALAMAYYGAGVWSLVAYNMVRQSVNTVMTFFVFNCRFGFRFSKERFSQMFPFAGKMLFAKFIDQGYVEFTQTIITKTYSATDLAFYNKGKSFPDLLINNLNSALASVMFPYFSGLQDDFERLKASLREAVRMTSFVCIPLMTGLIACADNFIEVVLTEKWMPSIPFLQLFCFYYIWIPFSNLIWQSLKGIGKSGIVLKLEIIKMSLNLVTLVFFLYMIHSPIAVAISIAVTYSLSFFAECFMAVRHLNYSIKEIFYDFAPSFILSAVMCALVMLVGKVPFPTYVCLVLQIAFGVVFYASAAFMLRFPQVKQIFSIIKKKK